MEQGRLEKFSRYLSGFILIAICVSWMLRSSVHEFMTQAVDSEAKTNLSSIHIAQKAFHNEYHAYSTNPSEIGYSTVEGLRSQVYFKPDDVPQEVMSVLPQHHRPYVAQDSYKVLLTFKHQSTGSLDLWILTEDGTIRKLSEKVALK
ncbi:hypothetical protein D3C72_1226770 [compost metagenome]